MRELIVDFRPAVTEDQARAAVEAAGGTVRRRMRNDDPALVRLLVRIGDDDAAAKRLAGDASVARIEHNDAGYRPL